MLADRGTRRLLRGLARQFAQGARDQRFRLLRDHRRRVRLRRALRLLRPLHPGRRPSRRWRRLDGRPCAQAVPRDFVARPAAVGGRLGRLGVRVDGTDGRDQMSMPSFVPLSSCPLHCRVLCVFFHFFASSSLERVGRDRNREVRSSLAPDGPTGPIRSSLLAISPARFQSSSHATTSLRGSAHACLAFGSVRQRFAKTSSTRQEFVEAFKRPSSLPAFSFLPSSGFVLCQSVTRVLADICFSICLSLVHSFNK